MVHDTIGRVMGDQQQSRRALGDAPRPRSSLLGPARLNRPMLTWLGRASLGLAAVAFAVRALDLAMPGFESPVGVFLIGAVLLFLGGFLVDRSRRGVEGPRRR
jgi:hypothetical protein